MADFEIAFQSLIKVEGGFAAHDGHNGAVNFGVTSSFLKLIGKPNSVEDVRNLTIDDAKAIYLKWYWNLYKLDQIQDQRTATLLFHMVVNNLAKIAILYFQMSLQESGVALPATGIMGPRVISGVNGLAPDTLLRFVDVFKGKMLARYQKLAQDNPHTYAKDLPGWTARLASL